MCGGRGDCVCGECQCQASDKGTISGAFCQCLDWTCPQVPTCQLMSPVHMMSQVNGEMCGGHGVCECGECKCEPGWTGDTCSCR